MSLKISDIDWSSETGSVYIPKFEGWDTLQTGLSKKVTQEDGKVASVTSPIKAQLMMQSGKKFWEMKIQDLPAECIQSNGLITLQYYKNEESVDLSSQLMDTKTFRIALSTNQLRDAVARKDRMLQSRDFFLRQALIEKIQTVASQIEEILHSYSQAFHTYCKIPNIFEKENTTTFSSNPIEDKDQQLLFTSLWKDLQRKKPLVATDFVFVIESKKVAIHKGAFVEMVKMREDSEVFSSWLSGGHAEKTIGDVQEVAHSTFLLLRTYLYLGEIEVEKEELTPLYIAADRFLLLQLKKILEPHVILQTFEKALAASNKLTQPKEIAELMIDQIMACSKDDEMLRLFSQATERLSAFMEKTYQVFESLVIKDEKIALDISYLS